MPRLGGRSGSNLSGSPVQPGLLAQLPEELRILGLSLFLGPQQERVLQPVEPGPRLDGRDGGLLERGLIRRQLLQFFRVVGMV